MHIESVKIEKVEKVDSAIAHVTGVKNDQDEINKHVDLVRSFYCSSITSPRFVKLGGH